MNKVSRKKGFTLIELIAVLVIMAIIALIVTPLVMNIIRKARVSADKRSIDAYGRSIELAIAGYLLDTGKFPTALDELTIEYSGNEVVCSTEQLNNDSSIYLSDCTVAGRSVDYVYQTIRRNIVYETYNLGDYVEYNNVNYYVIEDSDSKSSTLKLLKDLPLTKTEIQNLNLDIDITESNGYAKIVFGQNNIYDQSNIKTVVDKWAMSAIESNSDLKSVRLVTYDELLNNFGYTLTDNYPRLNNNVPTWFYNSNYSFWLMSKYITYPKVYGVDDSGEIWNLISTGNAMVRPVLELYKTADITKLNS